ncbi:MULTISPECIES: SDR family oxidoreductase [Paraburkholderia]|jgi:NAD(P)-dependent dehydrogenase (short-subunit alcohol dehydrogenase family)|uniref:NADP-dependent 3-hydroxy acid dehydrogenase YdfG n=1 Tax=Paraburkholderia phenazinium TaxID=60549 RepID=A0A1N6GAA1_9BURK|nr:SDR family oxidoreductase [Paraburkholderia phenazinium]SIO04453.1 NADP-dependent 3-hydroxy acid dehydrogenase YdfG [Paraburkholderia phenazinium]
MANRFAVVTGAGSGVGRAVATALLQNGYSVALAGRRQDALEETARLAGGSSLVVPTDVSKPDEVQALFARVAAEFGRLDVLFNNAGTGSPATNFGDVTFEQWSAVIDVNIHGMFLCANAAFRMMRDQSPRGGRIINNGSLSAHVPRPGSAPYTTSKHAVTGLTKCIGLDGRAFDIVSSQVDIGNAATPMTARMAKGVLQPNGTTAVEPTMDAANVGNTVLLIANMSLDANVQFVSVMASQMPSFLGRG